MRYSLRKLSAAGILTVVIFTLTHLPRGVVPVGLRIRGGDKLVHGAAYGILGWLLLRGVYGSGVLRRFVAVLVLTMAIGGADELTQPIVGRSCELFDWLADTAGACVAVVLWQATSKLLARRRPGAAVPPAHLDKIR